MGQITKSAPLNALPHNKSTMSTPMPDSPYHISLEGLKAKIKKNREKEKRKIRQKRRGMTPTRRFPTSISTAVRPGRVLT